MSRTPRRSIDEPALSSHTEGPQAVPDAALPMNVVIVGNTGSGKSAAARSELVERLLAANRRLCIMDPTGIWWGLRFTAAGHPSWPIAIAGGLYGDAPLAEDDGERLARWVGENDQSIIVDVSEMMIGERQTFAEHFFAALYKYNRRPLYLIVDEADEFAPQNPMPETRRLLHQFDRIVRRGRVRGFRVVMITQRPSVLHKNVMSQAKVLIAMQLLGSQDRDAVQLWIKGQGDLAAGKEVLNTLARLQRGEGWLWVPGLNILNRGPFRLFTTFDSSRTPDDDEPAVEPPGPFPYQGHFEMLRAVLERDDEPEPESRTGAKSQTDQTCLTPADIKAAEERGYERGLALAKHTQEAFLTSLYYEFEQAEAAFSARFLNALADVKPKDSTPVKTPVLTVDKPAPDSVLYIHATKEQAEASLKRIEPRSKSPQKIAPAAKGRAKDHNGKPAGEKMLRTLARYADRWLSWADVGIATGLIINNGHWYGGRKYLIEQKLIDEQSGEVCLSTAGLKIAGGKGQPLTRAELLALWKPKLRAPGGQMLEAIAGAEAGQVNKAQLATMVGLKPDNGYWYGGVKALRSANLIDQEGDQYRLTTFMRETG